MPPYKGKGKVHLRTDQEGPEGEYFSLTSALDGARGQ
jgi:hypothetical protein